MDKPPLERAIDKIRAVKDGLQEDDVRRHELDYAIMLVTHETVIVEEERERWRLFLRCFPPMTTIEERKKLKSFLVEISKYCHMSDVARSFEYIFEESNDDIMTMLKLIQETDIIRLCIEHLMKRSH